MSFVCLPMPEIRYGWKLRWSSVHPVEKDDIQVNKADYTGATPLYIAAREGHEQVVKTLLKKHGIEVNKADNRPISQRFCATSHTVQFYCVRRRTKSLRNGPKAGDTPIAVAAHLRHGKIVDLLLGTDEIRAVGWDGWRPVQLQHNK